MKVRPQLDKLIERAVILAAPLYRRQVKEWIRQAVKIKSFDQEIKPTISKEIGKLFELTFTIFYLFGRDVASDQIEVLRLFEKKAANFALWQRVDWSNTGFKAAVNRFKAKKIISAPEFKAAAAEIKAIAFSVQRVEEENALKVFNESIIKSINSGATLQDWKDELPGLFLKSGYGVKDPDLKPWHLETIFRTNQASVYEAGKWDQYQKDNYVVGIEYIAIMDTRTRDEHAALNGFIAPKGDKVWTYIYAPNGYQCRCTSSPVSEFYMREKGLKYSAITDKVKEGIAGVHEDFIGKNGLLGIDKRIRKALKEKIKAGKEAKKIIKEITPAKTKAEAIKQLKELGFFNIDRKMNLNSYNLTIKNIRRLKEDGYEFNYFELFSSESKNFHAASNEERLIISNYWTSSIKKLKEELEKSKKIGWLANARKDEAIDSLFTHEYAHHLTSRLITYKDDLILKKKNIYNKFKKAFDDYLVDVAEAKGKSKVFISEYAKYDLSEFIAEAFAMYKHSDNPSPYAIQVGKLLDKYFKKGAK